MKKLHVLQIMDSYFPCFDGPANALFNYTKHLNEFTTCDIMVPRYPKYEDNTAYKIIRVKSIGIPGIDGYRMPLPFLDRKAKKYFKENKVDIIHCHSPFEMGRFAVKMGKKYNIPVILTLHTKYDEEFQRLLKSKLLRKIMMKRILKVINAVDNIFVVSPSTLETLRKLGCKAKAEVVLNGTDLQFEQDCNIMAQELRKKYNPTGEKHILLSVGRIVENKNLDLILNSLKILKAKKYPFKMLFVGNGSYLSTLQQNALDLGLTSYDVEFVGRIDDRKLLASYYASADLFLFPSFFDTVGLVTIEAAAFKVPTLFAKGSSASSAIHKNVDGFYSIATPTEWAKKIEQIFADKQKLADVSKRCNRTIYRSWKEIADEVYGKYQNISNVGKKVTN